MLQRYEIFPSMGPNYDGCSQWIDPADIPGPVLAALDAGHGEVLAQMAERLIGMEHICPCPNCYELAREAFRANQTQVEAPR